jgi:hypothetical protein
MIRVYDVAEACAERNLVVLAGKVVIGELLDYSRPSNGSFGYGRGKYGDLRETVDGYDPDEERRGADGSGLGIFHIDSLAAYRYGTVVTIAGRGWGAGRYMSSEGQSHGLAGYGFTDRDVEVLE